MLVSPIFCDSKFLTKIWHAVSQQGGRRLCLPLLVASHVGQDVQGCNPFLFTSFSHLLQGSAGIDDFPIWVQLIPRFIFLQTLLTSTPHFRVIFNVICSKMRVDYITRESLRNFYENFSGLGGDNLEKVATEGYRSMSAVSSSFFSTISSLLTFRMGIMNWTTKATSSFSQTSSLEEQSMDLVGDLFFVSSEGALVAITPYDYTVAAAPTFWAHTGPR